MEGMSWEDAATVLTHALHQHSYLTSLCLAGNCVGCGPAALLFPAIARLPSLNNLHLDISLADDTRHALQLALASLPHLQQLSLSLGAAPESLKRQREADALEPSRCCLSSLLAAAARLTSLAMKQSKYINEQEFFTFTAPLSLPHLKRVDCELGPPEGTSAFLGKLSAPLTALDLSLLGRYPPAQAPTARQICRSLADFPSLKCLTFDCPSDASIRGSAVPRAVTAHTPPALAALSELQQLSITAEFPVLHASVPLLADDDAATSLTRLQLEIQRCTCPPIPLTEWSNLFQNLHRLPLRSLDISTGHTCPDEVGLAALAALPALSALRVSFWYCLQTPADFAALARLTQLQNLFLTEATSSYSADVSLMHSLSALTGLTALAIEAFNRRISNGRGTDKRNIAEGFIAHARPDALPALQQLCFGMEPPYEHADGVIRVGHALPSLTRLMLDLYNVTEGTKKERARNAATQARLKRVAAAHGVPLVFDTFSMF